MEPDLDYIREKIVVLSNSFKTNPLLYFSESDLQSELFMLLLEKYNTQKEICDIFLWGPNKQKNIKGVFTKQLHSELLLPEGRIDLSILDLDNVRFAVNSKGYFGYVQLAEGGHVFIEIKASRTNRSSISRAHWNRLLMSDVDKLNKYNHPCFLVCFDFKQLLTEKDVFCIQEKTNNNVELQYFWSPMKDNYYF